MTQKKYRETGAESLGSTQSDEPWNV